MKSAFAEKIRNVSANLNLRRTIGLTLTVARGWTVVALGMIVVETGLFFGSLYMLKELVDAVSGHMNDPINHHLIFSNLVYAAALAIFYNVAKAVSAYTTEMQAARVTEYIDGCIHDSAVRLPLSFFESHHYFDILKRAKDAGAERPNAVVISLIDILKNLLSLIAIGTMLFTIDWFLLPLLVLLILPTMVVRIYFSDKLNQLRVQHTPTERKAAYLSNLITSDLSAKEIRTYRLGGYLRQQYLSIRNRLVNERLRISFNRTTSEVFTVALASFGFFGCMALITYRAIHGHTTAGDITLFLFVFPQTFSILQQIFASIAVIYHNNIYVKSIFELLDLQPLQPVSKDSIPMSVGHLFDICFDDVSFTYPHSDRPTLTRINMKIPSGKIIAVVGMNGAGKTTLIKLLSRLYDPTSGHIRLNGIDIDNFEADDYRKRISVVFQDFSRYNVTARDNIRFGDVDREDTTETEIELAAKRAGADGYIKDFPNGYDTMMGRIFEDGHEVSIGQWQKLATARAFYANSRLVILDEATSALDAIAEQSLFDSLREHIGDRSALVISHRYSTIKQADYIYVLADGCVSEHGTNQQLMSKNGDFARLFGSRLEPEEA